MTEFYTTGRPCKRGHVAPRFAKSSHCVDCSRRRQRVKREARRLAKKREETAYHEAEKSRQRQRMRQRRAENPSYGRPQA